MSPHFVLREVVWVCSAELELGEIWRRAGDRGAVVSAADDIDYMLKDSAHILGTELSGELKRINWRPLRALFEILQEEKLVRILAVKRVD